jgi:hypothetical protein
MELFGYLSMWAPGEALPSRLAPAFLNLARLMRAAPGLLRQVTQRGELGRH